LSQGRLIQSCLGLAQELLYLGGRPAAPAVHEKILLLAPAGEGDPRPKSVVAQQVINPAWNAAGLIYAPIASTANGAHRKAAVLWKTVASIPGFNVQYRRFMDANTKELAEL